MSEMDSRLGEADALMEKLEKSGARAAGPGAAGEAGVSFGIPAEGGEEDQETLDTIRNWRREAERPRIKAQALAKK